MQCPTCCGLGRLTYDELTPEAKATANIGSTYICTDCGGTGMAHCGDGSCEHHSGDHAERQHRSPRRQ